MRAIIFANGILSDPNGAAAFIRPDDTIIAADGGARHCFDLGLAPELIIGDLDSAEVETLDILVRRGAKLEKHPTAKDETDLELALLAALRMGATESVVFGALGARWDMSLGNLLLMGYPNLRKMQITLVDGHQRVFFMAGGDTLLVDGAAQDTVSLIPIQGDAIGITTTGLEYPLAGETLRSGATRGISNVMTSSPAQISLKKGELLIVHIRQNGESS